MKTSPAALLVSFCLTLSAFSNDPVQDMKLRMDQAAARFHGMTADVQWISYTAALGDLGKDEQTGNIVILKNPHGEARALVNFIKPDAESFSFEKHTGRQYLPKSNTVNVYDLGKHADQVQQFIMIGFGTSGAELAKSYDMTFLGPDTVNGQETLKLELVPRSADVKKYVTKAELWVPKEGDPYPVQEKLYQPSKDYRISIYSNLRINPKLSSDAAQLKLPPGVKIVNQN